MANDIKPTHVILAGAHGLRDKDNKHFFVKKDDKVALTPAQAKKLVELGVAQAI